MYNVADWAGPDNDCTRCIRKNARILLVSHRDVDLLSLTLQAVTTSLSFGMWLVGRQR